jgi:hypothetical protein
VRHPLNERLPPYDTVQLWFRLARWLEPHDLLIYDVRDADNLTAGSVTTSNAMACCTLLALVSLIACSFVAAQVTQVTQA